MTWDTYDWQQDLVPPMLAGGLVGVGVDMLRNRRRKVTAERVAMAFGRGAAWGAAAGLAAPVVGVDVSDMLPPALVETIDRMIPG